MNKLFYWVLDNGHGNNTPGKRSPVWPNGTQLFEYDFNRRVVGFVVGILAAKGHKNFEVLVKEIEDISLTERGKRSKAIAGEFDSAIQPVLISVHGNGFRLESANGLEIYTEPGKDDSDPIGEVFADQMIKHLPELKFRADGKDGDKDKEKNLYITRKRNVKMPAVLLEFGFMTNFDECQLMLTDTYQKKCAQAIVDAIEYIETNGY